MKNVHHEGSVFLVSDAAADALLEYGSLLIGALDVRCVELPIIDEYGFIAHARIPLGPATGIVVTCAEDDELEPADADFVAALDEHRRYRVEAAPPAPSGRVVGRVARCPAVLLGVRCDCPAAHPGQHRATDDVGATWAWIGRGARL